jgi:ABC-2 type transport system permease protein
MKMTSALLRSFVRNRQALFWTFFFPVLLMVVFSFLGGSNFSLRLIVVGGKTPTAQRIVRAYEKIPYFKVQTDSPSEALHLVRTGQADAALILPARPASPLRARLVYNGANPQAADQTVSAVESAAAQINLALTGHRPFFVVDPQVASGSRSFTYLDFLLPGILALMAMQNSLFGVSGSLTRWKEKGVLRRFLATPLRPSHFLMSVVLYQLVLGIVTSAIIVGIATAALHASVELPWLALFVTLLIGMSAFLTLGFVIAGVSRTQEATLPIVNAISFPMMFLSGVFFPVSSLPRVLADIVQYFPLTYMANALRGLMSGQLTIGATAFGTDILGLLVWLVATGAIASRTWHWE